MLNNVLISEIFQSIQGEGLYVGTNQLFIRFSKCNLNCSYCDTNFKSNLKEYNSIELSKLVNEYNNIHSLALTGGEPLMETDFLLDFLPRINHPVYLETNGTLTDNLKKLIRYIDIISMDIKLPSSTNGKFFFKEHEDFIKIAKQKELFLKIVFDENITNFEIKKCSNLASKHKLPIVLQPKMTGNELKLNPDFIQKIFNDFINLYSEIRLIPQVHKFLHIN